MLDNVDYYGFGGTYFCVEGSRSAFAMDWPVLSLAPTIATLTADMIILDLNVMYKASTFRCSTGYCRSRATL